MCSSTSKFKEHGKERKIQARQYPDKLEKGSKVLVRNLTPRANPRKHRPYCEPRNCRSCFTI